MMKIRDFLRKILIVIFAIFIAVPGFADTTYGSGDIGDYGTWATEENRSLVTGRIVDELNNFGPTATTVAHSYVPIEAKLGLAFMGGVARVGVALDNSLATFAIMFMLIALKKNYPIWAKSPNMLLADILALVVMD